MSSDTTDSNSGVLLMGFTLTWLVHTGLFWGAAWVLSDAGVISDRISWQQCGFLALAYTISKVWMSVITDSGPRRP